MYNLLYIASFLEIIYDFLNVKEFVLYDTQPPGGDETFGLHLICILFKPSKYFSVLFRLMFSKMYKKCLMSLNP